MGVIKSYNIYYKRLMVTYLDGDRDEVEDWKELKLGRYAIQKYEYNEINSDFLVQYGIYMICDDSGLAGGGLDFIITAITLLVGRRRSVVRHLLVDIVATLACDSQVAA